MFPLLLRHLHMLSLSLEHFIHLQTLPPTAPTFPFYPPSSDKFIEQVTLSYTADASVNWDKHVGNLLGSATKSEHMHMTQLFYIYICIYMYIYLSIKPTPIPTSIH